IRAITATGARGTRRADKENCGPDDCTHDSGYGCGRREEHRPDKRSEHNPHAELHLPCGRLRRRDTTSQRRLVDEEIRWAKMHGIGNVEDFGAQLEVSTIGE